MSVYQLTNGQFYAQQPNNFVGSTVPRGSVARASNTVREREYNYGPLEFSQGISNSRTITKNNGGIRNGGTTSVARSNAISRELNIGGIDVGGTLTRSQTKTNGAVSNALGYDFNIGNLGIGSSISRDNLKNGFGLHRNSDGTVGLGLGLLDVDLTRNAQQKNQPLSQAQVNVQGRNAKTRANSNTQSNTQQYGNIGVTDTISRSNAFGSTRFGQTSANLGNPGGSPIYTGAPNFYRPRRNLITYKRIQPNSVSVKRPKRHVLDINIESKEHIQRNRRQFQYPNQRQNFFNPYGQSSFLYPQNQNINSQGIANNRGNLFQQQAGANTHTNKKVTPNGVFQDNGASSIGSNIANDGLSGQVSSANTAQMNSQSLDSLMMSNNAQSQSLNFDPNQQQATSSNAGTTHSKTKDSERIESNSGSQVTNNNQYGSLTNIANTNTAAYEEGNIRGVQSDASSQSIFQGANGENSDAFTNSNTNSVQGPDGFVSNSAVSNASASSQGGNSANASASASASSVSNANGASSSTNSVANANGFNAGGNSFANSGANSGFGYQGFRRG
ncbi:uncharacterized protein LOC119671876 isoform X2 [Teleopsis dalmanni]|uniref:uncharacterized protein LOC119671876 isoform X2 n=1 Tax=Teleopsis dalmanni TaxID=139649 RepID=UPI0018CEA9F0|nr:uncharacterized protein LOC119671876 isoform X2 [Teleopsis dalmanni]